MVKPFSFLYPLVRLSLIQLSILSSARSFTIDLIHRDSPLSPLYNASETHSRLKNVIIRSHSRVAYLRKLVSKSKQNLQAPIVPTEYEYLIKLSIGTPPHPLYGIIDIDSELSWTQCSPCVGCYKQDYPLFDPKKSSTYKPVPCSSDKCKSLGNYRTSCAPKTKSCQYEAIYAPLSGSTGEVAVETFTFGTTVVPDLLFSCAHYTLGMFSSKSTGYIGLGLGKGSFARQLNNTINGKFSYCFTSYDKRSNTSGKISFGDDAIVSGPGVVSIPLVHNPDAYSLTLQSVQLGNKTFPHRSPTSRNSRVEKGNIFMDSTTPLTYLPLELLTPFKTELEQAIKGTPIPDPQGYFDLCYNKTSVKIDGPGITFEFDGAALEVPLSNGFLETSEGLLCLGILPSTLPVFGNLLQVNFLVGYDLVEHKISFKPTDCSRQ